MIIEYAVTSLALNYPCKKYQIIFVYMHEKLILMKSEFVWNVHIQAMLKVISFSILNMHDFAEMWKELIFLAWYNTCHTIIYWLLIGQF